MSGNEKYQTYSKKLHGCPEAYRLEHCPDLTPGKIGLVDPNLYAALRQSGKLGKVPRAPRNISFIKTWRTDYPYTTYEQLHLKNPELKKSIESALRYGKISRDDFPRVNPPKRHQFYGDSEAFLRAYFPELKK